MSKAVYKGIVRGRTVVLRKAEDLPEGAEVLVTPVGPLKGSPRAVLTVMDAPPQIKPEDADELMRLIEEGKRPVRYESPLTRKRER
jgi:hypothetical protein